MFNYISSGKKSYFSGSLASKTVEFSERVVVEVANGVGENFELVSGKVVCRKAGRYLIGTSALIDLFAPANLFLTISVNGSSVGMHAYNSNVGKVDMAAEIIKQLEVGDVVCPIVSSGGGAQVSVRVYGNTHSYLNITEV